MAPTPVITARAVATPVILYVKRNLGGTNSPSTVDASATATNSAAAASASAAQQQQQSGWGNKGSILNWAAIAVVLGLMLAIAAWRMATVRHKSFKGFFLPNGLVIKWLGINISPAPPPPARQTLAEIELERRARRADERFQRRRTRGDNIGEGGQRTDARLSQDDDDDADTETLPGYKADVTAPIYLEEWRERAVERGEVPELDPETEDAIRNSGPVVRENAEGGGATGATESATGDAGEERIMSVAEYEARSRVAQDGPTETAAQDSARASERMTEVPLSSPTGSTPTSATALRRPEIARLPSGQPPMYETGRQD